MFPESLRKASKYLEKFPKYLENFSKYLHTYLFHFTVIQ